MGDVLSNKSNNQSATNTKSNMTSVTEETTIYYDPPKTIPAGQWIPFAGFTYPLAIVIPQRIRI